MQDAITKTLPIFAESSHEAGTWCAAGFKGAILLLCAILPPGMVDAFSGGRLMAMVVPEAGDAERLGITGICALVACVLFWVAWKFFDRILAAKDDHIRRLELENDRLAKELNKERRKE